MSWKGEESAVRATGHPMTRGMLAFGFQEAGLRRGDTVIVHSSMSKIGWIVGGPVDVILALTDVITCEGTIVMPTHSTGNSEPSFWRHPPVPETWWPTIRKHMPAFDPQITPSRGVGIIPQVFRSFPGVVRSDHPQDSFAAWGKHASTIAAHQPLSPEFGDDSPVGRVYKVGGKVLLIGVDHQNNTSLHYAELLAQLPNHPIQEQGAAVMVDGKRKWISWKDLDYDSDDFSALGEAYEKEINYTPTIIGNAVTRLVSQVDLVDFAINWFRKNRKYGS